MALQSRPIVGRLNRLLHEEAGQTQTEYLMIIGLIAAVIVTVFTVMFWPAVSAGVSALVSQDHQRDFRRRHLDREARMGRQRS